MRQIESDLWQSTVHQSGILSTHAYFLARRDGNVLFYNTGDDRDLDEIADLGGIRYQLLSHRDESGPSLERIRSRFGSTLCCSALEAPAVARDATVDVILENSDRSLGDIEIIHTPGHTDGSVCFLYPAPNGKAYLFSGDTIFQWNARWATLVLRNAGEPRKRSSRACSGCENSSLTSSCGADSSATCRSPRSRATSGTRPSTKG